MNKVTLYLVSLLVPAMLLLASCGGEQNKTNENDANQEQTVNEFDLMMTYLEESGDYMNNPKVPSMIGADKVKELIDAEAGILVLDIRHAKHYAEGHIPGAINMAMADVYDFAEENDLSEFEKIILACYSGQSASYTASILRLVGNDNVYALKWGMCSWSEDVAKAKWGAKASNKYAEQLEMDANEKNAAGEYPVIKTGEKEGEAIFKTRSKSILTKGFGDVTVKVDDVFANPDAYYIVNYWSENLYAKGHIPGALQYTPKKSLNRASELSTLPTDKTIVVYCYTGQHAAFVTAYLNAIGYDAKVLLYGANSFMNEMMIADEEIGHGFSSKATMKYECETSEYEDVDGGEEEVGGC